MVSKTGKQELSPLVIAALYGLLLVILMAFFVILALIYSNGRYTMDWIPQASNTIMDLIKVVVGAIIGVLTPVAAKRFRREV